MGEFRWFSFFGKTPFLGVGLLLALAIIPLSSNGQPSHRCGNELYRAQWQSTHPFWQSQQQQLEDWLDQTEVVEWLSQRSSIVIPVVVHVVYQNEVQNISDEQIHSQIDVLNADYRALNESLSIIPEPFQALIADMEVEFCLAQRTPDEEGTNGIVRVATTEEKIGATPSVHYSDAGGSDAWNPQEYLNIWLADMGGDFAGRANFPGEGPEAEDGVVIDPRFFGTIGTAWESFPYHLGRTTTHEIGHYFNLQHIWGIGSAACGKSDNLEDTPETSNTFLGNCPNVEIASCGSSDMYTNYMYYTDDACMAQFTPDQKAWMLATLNTLRPGLLTSAGCLPPGVDHPNEFGPLEVSLFPSPTSSFILLESTSGDPSGLQVELFSIAGRRLFQRTYSPNIRHRIELSWVPEGVYVVRIRQGETVKQKKIVVGPFEY